MRSTYDIKDELLQAAVKYTRASTKNGALNLALEDWLKIKEVHEFRKMRGKLHWDGDLKALKVADLNRARKLDAKRSR